MFYTFTPQLAEITYSVAVDSENVWMDNLLLVVSLLTVDYNVNFDQNTMVIDDLATVRPGFNHTVLPVTSTPDVEEPQMMVSITVLYLCVLFVTAGCVAITIVVVCVCMHFWQRQRRKYHLENICH